MNKEITRENAAHFLEVHLENVMEKEKERSGSVKMSSIVSEQQHECGTVCCMHGWLSDSYPHLFKWKMTHYCLGVYNENDEYFHMSPIKEIGYSLWNYLTAMHLTCKIIDGLPDIFRTSSFSEVKSGWQASIKQIRAGKLDEYLNFD